MPPLKVADLGCGEGYLTIEAARWAARVIAVDRSDVVLQRARALARRRRVSNVIWKNGELATTSGGTPNAPVVQRGGPSAKIALAENRADIVLHLLHG